MGVGRENYEGAQTAKSKHEGTKTKRKPLGVSPDAFRQAATFFQMEFVLCWLRQNWLVILHLGGTVLLLFAAKLVDGLLPLYLGERSRFVQSLERSFVPFLHGWLACQIGLVSLWCALAQQGAVRRLVRAFSLLTLGWIVLLVSYLAERPPPRLRLIALPIMLAVGAFIFFAPTLLFAWCFRFQNRWRLIGPHEAPQTSRQFTLADLFRITTLACVVSALAAVTSLIFEPVVWEGGTVPWYYYSLFVSAIGLNLLVVPILLLGTWGLLSDIEMRSWISATAFGALFLLNLAAIVFIFPPIRNYPITPHFESIAAFIAGMLVPGMMTAWLVRRAGYRLVRLQTR